MGCQLHAPAALPPRNTQYLLYRQLRGPQGRCGKSRPPPGFHLRTVQAVASRSTDYEVGRWRMSQHRNEPPFSHEARMNYLYKVTLALRGKLRHAMQQETYASLEWKTPEFPQVLEEVNDEHKSTKWSNSCIAKLNNAVTRDVTPYASTRPNCMSCQSVRLARLTAVNLFVFICSFCGWRKMKVIYDCRSCATPPYRDAVVFHFILCCVLSFVTRWAKYSWIAS
jgi:hypothetical protein